jgi:hypothetical protein
MFGGFTRHERKQLRSAWPNTDFRGSVFRLVKIVGFNRFDIVEVGLDQLAFLNSLDASQCFRRFETNEMIPIFERKLLFDRIDEVGVCIDVSLAFLQFK